MRIWFALVFAGTAGLVLSQAGPPLPDARASDPVALGWTQGTPPPGKVIRIEDGSFLQFPKTRWSFSHMRELVPTVNVPRGPGVRAVKQMAAERSAQIHIEAFLGPVPIVYAYEVDGIAPSAGIEATLWYSLRRALDDNLPKLAPCKGFRRRVLLAWRD